MVRTNFFKTALASMLVVCATAFYSCDSDGEEPGDEGTTSAASIIGKWEVTDGGNTRAAGDTKYGSFEFTADNKYIITQPAVATNGDKYMLVIFGDYVVGNNESNDLTLNLKEFGTIKISINKTSASITIDGVVYVAVKAKEVNLSDKTKLLCGTWNIKWKWDSESESTEAIMSFTSFGTYLLASPSEENPKEMQYDNGTWEWKSDNLAVFYTGYYGTDDSFDPITGEIIPGESFVEHGFYDFTVVKLTKDEFIIKATDDEGDILHITGTK